jgi:hypothetical protein
LAAALEAGARHTIGFEGSWVSELEDERIDFRQGDLELPLRGAERSDLVISLEVAEHLSAGRADSFVDDLCAIGDRILFSAAIPGQGGRGHVNEQWQSWWASKFTSRGYGVIDCVRPLIWNDALIPYWYRQNVLLYEKGATDEYRQIDVVHPVLWDDRRSNVSIKERLGLAGGIPGQLIRRLSRKRTELDTLSGT